VQLVELAIKGGGPDNITCIVADVVDSTTTLRPPSRISVRAGAASNGDRPQLRTNSPAGRAHALSQTAPQAIVVDHEDPAPRRAQPEPEPPMHPRRRWPIVTSVLVLLLVVIIGGGYFGWRYTQDQYYVGTDGGKVAIFQGINQNVAGVHLSHVFQRTSIPVSGVPTTYQSSIEATTSPGNLSAARGTVTNVQKAYQTCQNDFKALNAWNVREANFTAAQNAFKAKYHTIKDVRNSRGRITHQAPRAPKGSAPQVPSDCPATGQSTGTGGGS
jgi:PPM family protein phosphatase